LIVIEVTVSPATIEPTFAMPSVTVPNRLYGTVGPEPGQAVFWMKNWLPLTGPPGTRAIPTAPSPHGVVVVSSGRLYPGPPRPSPRGSPPCTTQSSAFQKLRPL